MAALEEEERREIMLRRKREALEECRREEESRRGNSSSGSRSSSHISNRPVVDVQCWSEHMEAMEVEDMRIEDSRGKLARMFDVYCVSAAPVVKEKPRASFPLRLLRM